MALNLCSGKQNDSNQHNPWTQHILIARNTNVAQTNVGSDDFSVYKDVEEEAACLTCTPQAHLRMPRKTSACAFQSLVKLLSILL